MSNMIPPSEVVNLDNLREAYWAAMRAYGEALTKAWEAGLGYSAEISTTEQALSEAGDELQAALFARDRDRDRAHKAERSNDG